jgi:2-polyprenyl-6-hydroxyphenyl methylase/3-demethylubiquinone-9 3-methyltransferase
MSIAIGHASEVRQGTRFEFGKNWQHFLSALTDERIAIAEHSLVDYLQQPRLEGLHFLDIGSGSGLFSLVARRLGASVTSFDYDPRSVACTAELRRRYFPDDPFWRVLRGSVLDRDFLAHLEPADIVYSWGVLHHTGAMAVAFANIEPLVPIGGRLFIAIYNDLGAVTDRWWQIKRRYNALPWPLRLPYALGIIGACEMRILAGHLRQRDLRGYLRTWPDYKRSSVRGMSRWHDWIDWIGGFPYERATVEAIVDIFAADGFRLAKLVDRRSGYGCNEFVFRREAASATWIDQSIPGSLLLGRRFGMALLDPQPEADGGLTGRVGGGLPDTQGGQWIALQQDRLLGEIGAPAAGGTVRIPPEIAAARRDSAPLWLVAGCLEAANRPFVHQIGHMWQIFSPRLCQLADNARVSDGQRRSPVFVFEDDRQLALPHSFHDDIRRRGAGRFSHWGDGIYFSTSDGSDPNQNGRLYRLIYPQSAMRLIETV